MRESQDILKMVAVIQSPDALMMIETLKMILLVLITLIMMKLAILKQVITIEIKRISAPVKILI